MLCQSLFLIQCIWRYHIKKANESGPFSGKLSAVNMLLPNFSLVLTGSSFSWIHIILGPASGQNFKLNVPTIWSVEGSSECSEPCLPGVLSSSFFICIILQTRPSVQPYLKGPKPSPAASVFTRAENDQEEIEWNGLTSPHVVSAKAHCFYLQPPGPKYIPWGTLTSLECVLFWCLARSEAFEKALLQPSCSQTYGFSPVCDLKCVFKFSSLE